MRTLTLLLLITVQGDSDGRRGRSVPVLKKHRVGSDAGRIELVCSSWSPGWECPSIPIQWLSM